VRLGAFGEDEPSNCLYVVRVQEDGSLLVFHEHGPGNDVKGFTEPGFVAPGQWNSVTAVRDSLSLEWRISNLNGDSCSIPFGANPTGGTEAFLQMGAETWGGEDYYHLGGKLTHLRIWNRQLSPVEVVEKAGLPLSFPEQEGLVAYWEFSEGAGEEALDESPNSLVCNLQGAEWFSLQGACTN